MMIYEVEQEPGDWQGMFEELRRWWQADTVGLYSGFGLELESLPDFVTVYIAEYRMPVAVRARRRQLREAAEARVPSCNSLPFCADFDFNPLVQGAYVFKTETNHAWNAKAVPWMHHSLRRAQGHFCCVAWLLLRRRVCPNVPLLQEGTQEASRLMDSRLMDDTVQIIVEQLLLLLRRNTYCVMQYNTPGRE
jgi:hypothetical protein